jgi:hypothetical protein
MLAILLQLYSAVLEFWTGLVGMSADKLATLIISVVFLSPYKHAIAVSLLGHDRFLPNP